MPREIVLVQPAMGRFEQVLGNVIEPLGLLCASRLVLDRFPVTLLDQRVERRFFAALGSALGRDPQLVGITSSAGSQLAHALAIARWVKERSAVPVVFGGPFASQAPDEFLAERAVDLVVVGEGEATLLELAEALDRGGRGRDVPGVFDREGGRHRGQTLDLDALPPVPWHLLRSPRYHVHTFGRKTVSLETTRGCPHTCGYCYNTVVHGSRWRAMSAGRALEAVRHAVRSTGAAQVYFTDDNFFSDRSRAFAIVRGLADLGVDWAVQGVCVEDVVRMTDAELDLVRESGCQGLFIGVQTGSERLQRLFRTGLDLAAVEPMNRRLAAARVPTWYFFMCGFPTETREDLQATVSLAARLLEANPSAVTSAFFLATPYPGTALHAKALEHGWPPRLGLEGWARTGWSRGQVPWLSDDHRRLVEALYFLSLFHDRKAERFGVVAPIRAFARLYRPLASHRLRHLDLRWFAGEDWIRKLAFQVYLA